MISASQVPDSKAPQASDSKQSIDSTKPQSKISANLLTTTPAVNFSKQWAKQFIRGHAANAAWVAWSTKRRCSASKQTANTSVAQTARSSQTRWDLQNNGFITSTYGSLCWDIASKLNTNANIHLSQSQSDSQSSWNVPWDHPTHGNLCHVRRLSDGIGFTAYTIAILCAHSFYMLFLLFLTAGGEGGHYRKSTFYLSYCNGAGKISN